MRFVFTCPAQVAPERTDSLAMTPPGRRFRLSMLVAFAALAAVAAVLSARALPAPVRIVSRSDSFSRLLANPHGARAYVRSLAIGASRPATDDSAGAAPEGDAGTVDAETAGAPEAGLTPGVPIESHAPVTAMTVSITTPGEGLVLVVANGTLVLDNRTGRGVVCDANVGVLPNAVPESTAGLVTARVDSSDFRTNHYVSFQCRRAYPCAAGTHTYYLNAIVRSMTGSASLRRPTMTAVFLPKM